MIAPTGDERKHPPPMSAPEIVSIFLLLGGASLLGALLASRLRFLPISAWFIVGGVLCAVAVEIFNLETGIRAHNFQDLAFFVLLPVLVFEAAYTLPQRALLHFLPAVLLMATFGLLLSMLISGAGIWVGINHPAFPISVALLAGALLAATDPVAVVNQIKELSAPKNLGVLVEGESLFNDATAIVVFSILLMLVIDGDAAHLSAAGALLRFLLVFFGGIFLGLIFGVGARLLEIAVRAAAPPSYISLLAAYGSFYTAEHLLHVSGVMAVLSAALCISWFHARADGSGRRDDIQAFSGVLHYPFTAAVFVLMGLVITVEMFTQRWLAILIAIPAVLLGRTAAVYCSLWLARLFFRTRIDPAYPPVLVWGGLRGVVTIALALSLPAELEHRFTIQAIAFGVVLFTLLVQAPTAPWLLRRLKIV